MTASPVLPTLRRYHALLYVATTLGIAAFWPHVDAPDMATKLYVLAATLEYAALYTLPVYFLSSAVRRVLWRGE